MVEMENGEEAGRLLRDYVRRLVYASPTETPETTHSSRTIRPAFELRGSQDDVALPAA